MWDVHDLPLSSPLCNRSPVNPALCNFKASCRSGVNLLARNIHGNEQAYIDGRSEKQADLRSGRVILDHTGGETLGGACLGTCVCKGSECLLAVDQGEVGNLWNNIKEGNEWQDN